MAEGDGLAPEAWYPTAGEKVCSRAAHLGDVAIEVLQKGFKIGSYRLAVPTTQNETLYCSIFIISCAGACTSFAGKKQFLEKSLV